MFTPSPEQEQLRSVLRTLFAERSSEQVVRQAIATAEGHDPDLWRQMAQELALLGMHVPEEYGGSGYTYAESCMVLEEAGRAMVCAPLLSTLALAANTLLIAADERTRKQLLPAIVDGNLLVAVALPRPGHDVRAVAGREGWVLHGRSSAVLDGAAADRLLVTATTPAGTALFEIDAHDARVDRRELAGLDLTRRTASVEFNAVPGTDVSGPEDLGGRLDRVRNLVVVGLACEQVGGAGRALDESVAYAAARVQFGRAIGSFQAVKHRLADMLVAVETAKSAAYEAVDASVHGTDEQLALAAAVAGSYCSEVFSQVAEDAIQVHGGIGFTWEHPAHLWFRRAKADCLLLGTPSQHRARLAELIP
jgi:alkylation response protein AidB-like acyl-CoA dehydrogenase